MGDSKTTSKISDPTHLCRFARPRGPPNFSKKKKKKTGPWLSPGLRKSRKRGNFGGEKPGPGKIQTKKKKKKRGGGRWRFGIKKKKKKLKKIGKLVRFFFLL